MRTVSYTHLVTHRVDAVRYYCISRVESAGPETERARDAEAGLEYDDFVHGGEPTAGYLRF